MTSLTTPETVRYSCPECGWSGDFDARFPAWCMQHDHALNALPPQDLERLRTEKGRARRRREAARRRGEALQQRLAGAAELRPGSGARLAAVAFSVLTHAVTVAVLVGSGFLLTTGNVVGMVIGLLGIGIAWVVRPRIPGALKGASGADWKSRSDLPQFFAILDRTAAVIGAPVPEKVKFSTAYNASTTRLGPRRTPVLILGMPLWTVLTREERIALLGHELGHQVNGDATHGLVADSAATSLAWWRTLFQPARARSVRIRYVDRLGRSQGSAVEPPSLQAILIAALTSLMFAPIFLVTTGLSRLQRWLDTHVGLRAEFAADGMAARTGSTQAAVRLMRKLDVSPSVDAYVRQAKAARKADPAKTGKPTPQDAVELMDGLREYILALPEHEYVRRARISEVLGTRVDASHPATYLRIRLLESRPSQSVGVSVTDEEWDAISLEFAAAAGAAGLGLLR